MAVHRGALGKCNIAGARPYHAHVTLLPTPLNIYISRGYKDVKMYVAFFTPWRGQGRLEGSDIDLL